MPHGQYGTYVIYMPEGGKIARELSGQFTSMELAEKAIESYLRTYWKGR